MTRIVIAALLATISNAWSQGTFQNLDFENPILPLIRDANFEVLISKAMPGWTGYIAAAPVDRIFYNTVSLGAAAISFHGPDSTSPILQGNYSVILQSSFPDGFVTAALGQMGVVPSGSRSVLFDARGGFTLTFSGQPIPLSLLGGSAGTFFTYGGDVSSFAGRSGESRIQGGGTLDNFRFSEPGDSGAQRRRFGGAWCGLALLSPSETRTRMRRTFIKLIRPGVLLHLISLATIAANPPAKWTAEFIPLERKPAHAVRNEFCALPRAIFLCWVHTYPSRIVRSVSCTT